MYLDLLDQYVVGSFWIAVGEQDFQVVVTEDRCGEVTGTSPS